MKDVAALLVAFLVIGLAWRKFTMWARVVLLGVIIVVVAYMTFKA
jgi:hypothetical protein